eukprot:8420395-Pyramimonas_sp.AAC.1
MEDERLGLLRRAQAQRTSKREDMCEALANDAPVPGTRAYLSSSVPGPPRHPRKLRTDSLEPARRKGPPTFFIAL